MELLKLVIFHSMHFADIVRCVAFCIIIIIIIIIIVVVVVVVVVVNGFLMTQRRITLKDVCGYIMLENLSDTRVGRFLS